MSDRKPGKPRELTGRHVLIIMLSAFGVIVAANMAMLFAATGSFPGLVVENSYRAGVGWNERTQAQAALGWEVEMGLEAGELVVGVTDAEGRRIEGLAVTARVGRPATDAEDSTLALAETGGGYAHPVSLGQGLWQVALESRHPDGTVHTAKGEIFVGEGDIADAEGKM